MTGSSFGAVVRCFILFVLFVVSPMSALDCTTTQNNFVRIEHNAKQLYANKNNAKQLYANIKATFHQHYFTMLEKLISLGLIYIYTYIHIYIYNPLYINVYNYIYIYHNIYYILLICII